MIDTKNQPVERCAPPILHAIIDIIKNTDELIMLKVSFLESDFLPIEKSEEIITIREKRMMQTIVIKGNKYD